MDNPLSQVHTTQELGRLTQSLTILENSLYKTDGVAPEGVGADLYAAFTKAADRKAFVDAWQKLLESAEVVNVTLAFVPKGAFVSELSAWTKQKFGLAAVLQINKDESIIGGIIVEKDGRVMDLSVESMFANSISNLNPSKQDST